MLPGRCKSLFEGPQEARRDCPISWCPWSAGRRGWALLLVTEAPQGLLHLCCRPHESMLVLLAWCSWRAGPPFSLCVCDDDCQVLLRQKANLSHTTLRGLCQQRGDTSSTQRCRISGSEMRGFVTAGWLKPQIFVVTQGLKDSWSS